MAGKFRSNEDLTRAISNSIFMTNFPDSTSAKDLWNLCSGYRTVVDVYIPNRRSKVGKWFAFVRFIKVENIDRLVGNLCTLWIGRMHIHANVVHFTHPPRATRVSQPPKRVISGTSSYVSAVKGSAVPPPYISPCLLYAQPDFVSRERIVWVDIEGDPLHSWSRETFCKIGSKWGEVIDLEECLDDCFGHKRICIKTKQVDNLLERFKIIVLGKVFNVRAKELAVWTPVFKDVNDDLYCSDDESVKESGEIKDGCEESNDAASDVEEVSDTFFGEPDVQHDDAHTQVNPTNFDKPSLDPFNIYDLLTKKEVREVNSGMDSSIPFPPGFTHPIIELNSSECHKVNASPISNSRIQTDVLSSRVMENAQVVDECHSTDSQDSRRKTKTCGSILDVLDNMINVGNTMGYSMEGCIKDMEKIIESQGGRNGLQ
ncbi:RNA-directed DNA polymerase, eukaryota [Tanacetum coccineum]